MPKKNSKYRFSFVMPVYNVESYIDEAVQSIINQSMSFRRYVQLILINDGSTDESEAVCRKYKDLYPNNIILITQKNKGVSAARNAGLKKVEGKYISFMDPDDKISSDTLAKVYSFFEKHYEQTDIVAIKLIFFGAKDGDHPLNDKYKDGDRVIDLQEEPDKSLTTIGNSFFKSSVARRYSFDSSLNRCEDSKFIGEVILSRLSLGVVSKPIYYYRQRLDNSSAVSNFAHSHEWYFDIPKRYLIELINRSISSYGKVPAYIQNLVLFELRWRFTQIDIVGLDIKQSEEYLALINRVLEHIDDETVVNYRGVHPEYRLHILTKKYGYSAYEDLHYETDGFLYYKDLIFGDVRRLSITIDFIEITQGKLVLEGWYGGFKLDGLSVSLTMNGKKYEVEESFRSYSSVVSLNDVIYKNNAFKVYIPLENSEMNIKPCIEIGNTDFDAQLRFGDFSNIQKVIKNGYRVLENHVLLAVGNSIVIRKYSKYEHIKREMKYLHSIYTDKRFDVLRTRLVYRIYRFWFRRKQVWLLMDRSISAGDNADYLYRYINKYGDRKIVPYFVVSKTDSRYFELKKVGRVVEFGTFKHGIIYLLSKKLVSSHYDEYLINNFGKDGIYYRDIYNYEFNFIGHGIMAPDLSRLMNRFKKNFSLITVASEDEKQSIVSNREYGYSDEIIKVTGYPRFDGLISSNTKKEIIFAPSWRLQLATRQNVANGLANGSRAYGSKFKQSEYFKFYNNLINDERITNTLKAEGYTGKFYIHPNHSAQWKDFNENDTVKIMQPPHDYERAFCEADIMVTDYSGVAFDFAYMKKPIVYAQFDRATFYQGHTYTEGFFSFEKDGFGSVVYDYESTVSEVVNTIKAGGRMKSKYTKRVDKFFYKLDQRNSERVYNEIYMADKKRNLSS